MMFQIMRKAQANDLILKNPVELADKSRHAQQKSKKGSFTAEEVRKLFKFLPHDKTGDSIRLLLFTGMRSQELFALEDWHIGSGGSCPLHRILTMQRYEIKYMVQRELMQVII